MLSCLAYMAQFAGSSRTRIPFAAPFLSPVLPLACLQSIIAAPSERLKLLIQIQTDAAHTRYQSPLHAARTIIAKHGYMSLNRGFLATLLRDCPAFGIYFASYEYMSRRMSKDGQMESLTGPQLLLAGGERFSQ
ncbi:hypothetical protein COOONC_27006 [Cooperia oncophora]